MKINLVAVLIRCITIMEKTESMAEEITDKAFQCFPLGNHENIYKWYDEDGERSDEKCKSKGG